MSADSAPKAQALKEAKRKEIRLERKRKGSVWTLYDGQVAALCRVKRHRLELAQGEVTSDIDRIDSIIANMRISAAGISVAIITVVGTLGTKLNATFTSVSSALK